jgi:putative ABC transport system permease protein
MRAADLLDFAWQVVRGNRGRTILILIAMGIGVAAVLMVTTLGEGARRYVLNQFSGLGANLLIVFPGRSETAGGTPGFLVGKTPRDLTIDDAMALTRSHHVRRIAPLVVGAGDVHWNARNRSVPVLGTTAEFIAVREMEMGQGVFLPEGDPHHAQPVCVIGIKIKRELFASKEAIGEWLRIGDRRFRVIGILASQGQSLGFNTDEVVIVPLASAQALFNTESLFRIMVEAKSRSQIPPAKEEVLEILRIRHEGERDVTVVTQDAVLSTFDRILSALTLAVAGIAAISLSVAGILIMNVMLISVSQRKREIGLLKALGASGSQVRLIFFTEAVLLALTGAIAGLIVGWTGQQMIADVFPDIPFVTPWWALVAAPLMALVTAVVFSVAPARQAARLDPVVALSSRK